MPAGLAARARAWLARQWWQPGRSRPSQLLVPLAALYGLLLRRRRARQPPAAPTPVPVLVVGNVVVGGAGKTPTVIALVQALQAAGHRPGVVSRGYGRSEHGVREVTARATVAEVGDEPLLMHRRCRVPVWVGRDRAATVRALCTARPEVDVVLSDDGLQHAGLARAAELLVFDDRGVGNGCLLPAGPLREPLPARPGPRQRVLYTGTRASTPLPGALAERGLRLAWPLAAWHCGDASQAVPLQQLAGRPLVAVAGIAAPEKFFSMLQAAGLHISRLPLPDHHDHAAGPWPARMAEAVTTEKDAVKLDPARPDLGPVWVLPLDFELPPALVAELANLLFESPESPESPP